MFIRNTFLLRFYSECDHRLPILINSVKCVFYGSPSLFFVQPSASFALDIGRGKWIWSNAHRMFWMATVSVWWLSTISKPHCYPHRLFRVLQNSSPKRNSTRISMFVVWIWWMPLITRSVGSPVMQRWRQEIYSSASFDSMLSILSKSLWMIHLHSCLARCSFTNDAVSVRTGRRMSKRELTNPSDRINRFVVVEGTRLSLDANLFRRFS